MKDLEIHLETASRVLAQELCGVCGTIFAPGNTQAVLIENGRDVHYWDFEDAMPPQQDVPVCPGCLDAGPKEAAGRARDFAMQMQMSANELFNLACRLERVHPENWASAHELAIA